MITMRVCPMFRMLIFAALLLCSSAVPNTRSSIRLEQSVGDVIPLEEKLFQLVTRLQLSQDNDDHCAFSSAAVNGSDAGLKSESETKAHLLLQQSRDPFFFGVFV